MKDNVVQVNLWNKNVGLLSWDDKRGCSVFATPKHLAKQPKKYRFQKQSTITPGVNWRCPRNRNSPRETYFPLPKSVIL